MTGRVSHGLAAIGLVAWCVSHGVAAQPATLSPDEVLRAVDRALPTLLQARLDVEAAEGEATSALGAFDLHLRASSQRLEGEYDNSRFSTLFEQPLAPWGARTYGGYKAGRGAFAEYDGKAATGPAGEVLAGIEVPLLRGRAIDQRRADRDATALGVERAEAQLAGVRLSAFSAALASYWDWVAAGRQLEVARAVLALAETRDQQLAEAVALGQIAAIERTDNQRAILQRRSGLVAAQRLVDQRAIDLSLFLRDADGQPARPAPARLPALPAPSDLTIPSEAESIAAALAARPELDARRRRRDQARIELALAQNTLLPSLQLFSEVSRDSVGTGTKPTGGASLELGLTFALPVQRRKAEGQRVKAQAAVAKAELDLRWLEDGVRAAVQDARSAALAAREQLTLVQGEVAVARELEQLERDRFALGDSTQFLVNLRELATADAEIREARARADVQKALVALEAATGRLLQRLPSP